MHLPNSARTLLLHADYWAEKNGSKWDLAKWAKDMYIDVVNEILSEEN